MRILVAGDAMIDRYVLGEVRRISPEAPVPVLSVEREEERQGGAANVARNIEAMGIEVRERYSPSFKSDPVVKLRVVAHGQQIVRVDFDRPQEPISPDEIERAAEGCDLVVLSDYAKGSLAHIAAIIWRCKRAGKAIIVDPKGAGFKRYEGVDVLKPNLAEARDLVGQWASEEDLEQRIKAMQRVAGISAVLLTRGAAGMTLYNGAVRHFPCVAREVYDVSGAGDTALAAFASAVIRGAGYAEAAQISNRAAGIAVSRFGTTVVTEKEAFG